MTGDYVLTFGKHKGKAIRDVPVDWLLGESFDDVVKNEIVSYLTTQAEYTSKEFMSDGRDPAED